MPKAHQILYNLHAGIIFHNAKNNVNNVDFYRIFKQYETRPRLTFPCTVSLSSTDKKCDASSMNNLSTFLFYCYGLQTINFEVQSNYDSTKGKVLYHSFPHLRKGLASGGSLYPNELYLYIRNVQTVPQGIYHYNSLHHELILLRKGNFDIFLKDSTSLEINMEKFEIVFFISVVTCKNFYKYNDFSYRLNGLDTGILIGQILFLAQNLRFKTSHVSYNFLDEAIHHLLGINKSEESIYALIFVSTSDCYRHLHLNIQKKVKTLEDILKSISEINFSTNLKNFQQHTSKQLTLLNDKSYLQALGKPIRATYKRWETNNQANSLILSSSSNFIKIIKKRLTPRYLITDKSIKKEVLLQCILQTYSLVYHHLSDINYQKFPIDSYLYLNNVDHLKKGLYKFSFKTKDFFLIKPGDFSFELSEYSFDPHIDYSKIPVYIHLAGSLKNFLKKYGIRGYRMLHMLAGSLISRLQLIGVELNLGCQLELSFEAKKIEQLYNLKNQNILMQIPLGYYSHPNSFTGEIIF